MYSDFDSVIVAPGNQEPLYDMNPQRNRLASETSPYLLQHADNPVDWHPWDAAALALAREQDRPILLSIGYSACHWCHVMAHESFEDPDTAALMNALFVNIKVDREERPELDKIYQRAHQLLNQRPGGWPLTVFLSPGDHTPFFAGTYFPDRPRHGMPSFREVLQGVADFYREQPDAVREQSRQLRAALSEPARARQTGKPDGRFLEQAREDLAASFDRRFGGFGQAPKFPHPTNLERLLRHWAASRDAGQPDRGAREMLELSLQAMAGGGLYDQLGGGFFRYSVDAEWIIPHFEKMLYDNGPLLGLYAEAGCAFDNAFYRRIAAETADWAIREMQSPEGGWWSTLDADSEGEEGRFYLWTPEQIRAVLTPEEYALYEIVHGLKRPANFEGRWHLNVASGAEQAAARLHVDPGEAHRLLRQARDKLFRQRQRRIAPGRDEKILTAWNGLMIKGMACAGRRLQRPDLITAARRAVDFLHRHLFIDGRLRISYKDRQAPLPACLDDYVFLMDGLLELLQARWRDADMAWLLQLAETVVEHFYDRERGVFCFTADDHEKLLYRPVPLQDEAIPAGNAVAASVLGRLGHLLGRPDWLAIQESVLRFAAPSIAQLPWAHCALLHALEDSLRPPICVVIRGEEQAIARWQAKLDRHYLPRSLCLAIPAHSRELPGALADKTAREGEVRAFVCREHTCRAPVTRFGELERQLLEAEAGAAVK